MSTTWIVLANASRARIFESGAGARRFREVVTLVHPDSRLKAGQLTADCAGHSERHVGDGGQGGAAFDPRTDPRQKEHGLFAREVAQALHEGVASHRCARALLVASNPFLGELKAQLGPAAAAAVCEAIPKDLSKLDGPELDKRMAEMVAKFAEN